ncbi:CBS domain-containing protein [Streptomyces sp. NBC_00257]|uniref:CBS domain-containing protein n=1 Tax=unclassified Streptomyces TaxID=2593676 RepID=UPI002254DB12|nr:MULTISPECIES: CBS domain-containing protein [unclassified Streptomyces]MCX4862531.1 CBS domain-containing protein [Streptomyces sp. NBC_00906]MCX4893768.1 CBS domain-containing protein [Streptomyces sp. NBC_00892]MCX5427115.1 CBS domain-containing protein [Streptomyces sp. NBC_00062]
MIAIEKEPTMEERQPGVVHDEQEVLARTVAVVMRTAAVTIDIDETVLVAWELLERSGSRYLPVVHSDGRCVGLLDRADMAVVCAAPAVSLSGLRVGDLHPGHRSAHVHAGQTVRHAADLMSRTEADAVLVLEEGGRLAGVLTTADIVAALAGRPMRKEPAGVRPQSPFTVLPGLPPRRSYRGAAVP